jgi:hypothetical protein
MSRASLLFAALVLIAGCRVPPEREAVLRPLPEGQAFRYPELLGRARTQATAALEAFYIDAWPDLEDAAVGLEQTARFLPKTAEIPVAYKDRIGAEAEQLRQDALKLGEFARAKNAIAVNTVLQRINLRIRAMRSDDKTPVPMPPAPMPPSPVNPVP